MPNISVIVPIYKVEQYLDRCVESILAQTFSDFELILVDDGSPDNCPKMCDEWAKQDERIKVIHKSNGGLSDARNVGIDWAFANSNSEWITFIDSDDWVHNEYLEKLYNAAVDNNVEVSVCDFIRTKGEMPSIDNETFQSILLRPEELYIKDRVVAIIAWAKLYKKECFENIRYPSGKLHEDEFTTYKILFKYDNIAVVFAPMYFYYQNTNGIMKSEWTIKRIDVLTAFFEQISYYYKNGFFEAAAETADLYISYFYGQIRQLMDANINMSVKIKYKKTFKAQLRYILRKYKKTYTIENRTWEYEFAYPFGMKIYWNYKALLNKFNI